VDGASGATIDQSDNTLVAQSGRRQALLQQRSIELLRAAPQQVGSAATSIVVIDDCYNIRPS
jgi:hypothetical protein